MTGERTPGWKVLRMARTPDPYLRDWLLWCDWCSAMGRPAVPAEPDHLVEFTAAMNGGQGTRRRRIRAIIAKCAEFGEPIVLEHPRPRLWDEGLGDSGKVLHRIPRWGWPVGLNRRRDAFVVVLASLGFTRRQVCSLSSGEIDLASGVTVSGRQVPAADASSECGRCAVHDWLSALATTVNGGRADAQKLLATPGQPSAHRCGEGVDPRWRSAPRLVPAIDRHGWLDDTRAVSERTVTQILRTWLSRSRDDQWEPAATQGSRSAQPARARSALDLPELLEELEAQIDTISSRVDELLQEVCRA